MFSECLCRFSRDLWLPVLQRSQRKGGKFICAHSNLSVHPVQLHVNGSRNILLAMQTALSEIVSFSNRRKKIGPIWKPFNVQEEICIQILTEQHHSKRPPPRLLSFHLGLNIYFKYLTSRCNRYNGPFSSNLVEKFLPSTRSLLLLVFLLKCSYVTSHSAFCHLDSSKRTWMTIWTARKSINTFSDTYISSGGCSFSPIGQYQQLLPCDLLALMFRFHCVQVQWSHCEMFFLKNVVPLCITECLEHKSNCNPPFFLNSVLGFYHFLLSECLCVVRLHQQDTVIMTSLSSRGFFFHIFLFSACLFTYFPLLLWVGKLKVQWLPIYGNICYHDYLQRKPPNISSTGVLFLRCGWFFWA